MSDKPPIRRLVFKNTNPIAFMLVSTMMKSGIGLPSDNVRETPEEVNNLYLEQARLKRERKANRKRQ